MSSDGGRIVGDDTAQTITGNDQANLILGVGGNDTIAGADGHDQILGGDGNDTIADFNVEEDVLDVSRFGVDSFDELELTQSGENVVLDLTARGGGQITLLSVSLDALGADQFDFQRELSDQHIVGTIVSDIIYGGDGNDRIAGRAGNDTVDGEAGNDNISGGAGDDLWTPSRWTKSTPATSSSTTTASDRRASPEARVGRRVTAASFPRRRESIDFAENDSA